MLNVFLPFPQTKDTISKIIADEISYKRFVKEYSETISAISRKNSVKLFYDSDNIKYFIEACREFENDCYLNKAENQIRGIIPQNSTDIKDKGKSKKDESCIYVLWNSNEFPYIKLTLKIIEEIAERIILYQNEENEKNEKFLLFNISKNIETDRNVLLVCKDDKHSQDMPKFAHIPYIIDKCGLDSWLSKNHIGTLSLSNNNNFEETKLFKQGKQVYQEIKTGNYWYLDNLHKNHYEVFDSNKNHIGEANLQGEIDRTKKIKGRTME